MQAVDPSKRVRDRTVLRSTASASKRESHISTDLLCNCYLRHRTCSLSFSRSPS
ncbi:hypothetical protein BC628DRAFT_1400320 [Trametes gibbosa]|nr:hypothetical protein BC628DRAFT_1400320 [Trametes gibbosa]